MGSRPGSRVVHFPNLPMKLLMPTSLTNIREIAFKTIPSASKIEIKRVLQSLYGFDVDNPNPKHGRQEEEARRLLDRQAQLQEGLRHAQVTAEEEKHQVMSRMKKTSKSSVVEEGEGRKHWLHGRDEDKDMETYQRGSPVFGVGRTSFHGAI